MRKRLFSLLALSLFISGAQAQLKDPFDVEAHRVDDQIRLEVTVPENHYLYVEHFKVADASGNEQQAIELPEAGSHADPVTGEATPVYDESFQALYAWDPTEGGEVAVKVSYMGCNERICFAPQKKVFELEASPQATDDSMDDSRIFTVAAEQVDDQVHLEVTIPANHYLYAEDFKVTDAMGHEQQAVKLPETGSIIDPVTEHPKPVYDQSFEAIYAWEPTEGGGAAIHVHYWGCNDSVCFSPKTQVFELAPSAAGAKHAVVQADEGGPADWQIALEDFNVVESRVESMKAGEFIDFLEQTEAGAEPVKLSGFDLFLSDPVAFVRESGLLLTILFILVGGLALNLTPCVLPMIPVNLAIIGAGAQAGSKGRGFALGATYGAGIALVYGLLGVIVVLTGSQFGTIQANPWFNLVIAAIFVVLALAMFDIIHIDFSRFQSKIGDVSKRKGSFAVALAMGCVAALLAGACVAPVVIAVLLLATNIYEANSLAGLLLPFVLGFGMALPWPFAGAGLSFLPKPGKWMQYIKYGFGVGIVFFALYYGHLSYRGFKPAEVADGIDGRTNEGFAEALRKAYKTGKPVLIDFTASWCKNCKQMELTTFKDEAVKAKLDSYTLIRYVSEDPSDPETKAVWDHFRVQGLPTFIVLAPEPNK